MTLNQAANRVADFTDSPWFKLFSVMLVPTVGAMLFWAATNLQDHSLALAKISVILDDLKAGQARIENTISNNGARIDAIVKTAEEQGRQIARIQQQIEDRPRDR